MDFRADRVRIYCNDSGKVSKVPRIGWLIHAWTLRTNDEDSFPLSIPERTRPLRTPGSPGLQRLPRKNLPLIPLRRQPLGNNIISPCPPISVIALCQISGQEVVVAQYSKVCVRYKRTLQSCVDRLIAEAQEGHDHKSCWLLRVSIAPKMQALCLVFAQFKLSNRW